MEARVQDGQTVETSIRMNGLYFQPLHTVVSICFYHAQPTCPYHRHLVGSITMKRLAGLLVLCVCLTATAILDAAPVAPNFSAVGAVADGSLVFEQYQMVKLKVTDPPAGSGIVWVYTDPLSGGPVSNQGREELWLTGPPGLYSATAIAVTLDKTGKVSTQQIKVAFSIKGKVGPTPVPPGPTPTPPNPVDPPKPDPVDPPAPAPIAGEGLRMLLVEESKLRNTLPKSQQYIYSAKEVRDYLRAKCPIGSDGKTPEYRIWDIYQTIASSSEDTRWKDAFKRVTTSISSPSKVRPNIRMFTPGKLPWVLISNGKTGYEGPLPANVPDMMALLKKFGG